MSEQQTKVNERKISLAGLSIIGENVMVDTLQIAKMTKRDHRNILARFKQFIEESEKLGLLNFKQSSQYINEQGKEQPMFIMDSDTSLKFIATFTKSIAMIVMDKMIECINQLKEALNAKDKEAVALVERYRLTDTSDCSNLSSICGRFDLTPQNANRILCDRRVLKRIKNGNQLIYRLTANYLGKDFCNIDQACDDLKTHLKWTDKNGLAFLSEFFEIEKEKEIIRKRELELRNHPTLFDLDAYMEGA